MSDRNVGTGTGGGSDAAVDSPVSRRAFLGTVGAVSAVGLTSPLLAAQSVSGVTPDVAPSPSDDCNIGALSNQQRRVKARKLRRDAADLAYFRPYPEHPCNGEETDYPFIANFSKGLPHDALGEVDPAAYGLLLAAIASEKEQDMEAVPLDGGRKLVNPHSGHAFDLEGPDSHHLAIPPAPRIDGPEHSSEMGEMYWHALARDVRFTDYAVDGLIAGAAADMSAFSDFKGPKAGGAVTPQTLFRIDLPGATIGPYISQFMLQDIPYGTLTISQRQRTAAPGLDSMTTYGDWLTMQRGYAPSFPDVFDPTARYIRNGRDLATYVHFDALYEAYLNAALILLGTNAPLNPGNPYLAKAKSVGFGTFGGPHILSLVCEVATRALKGIWFQKWHVHRRMRPEVFGGRVHNHVTGATSYPIDREILNSAALGLTFSAHGSYLLPQAYPEGSPLHPSYGSGHTTVAGACVTVLKWFFDEDFVLPGPVVPDADGESLVPYRGPDALTVGGELNKVAMNVSMGRNFAGIHWRTDSVESLLLGEAIAIGILEEQKPAYKESHAVTFTKFDGTSVTI